MKCFVFILFSFFSFASEYQQLLGDVLTYQRGSYPTILQSKEAYKSLTTRAKKDPRSVAAYLDAMVEDIRNQKKEFKNNLYTSECGTTAQKVQSSSIFITSISSPVWLIAGYLTQNFCITLTGSIGTGCFLPCAIYYLGKECKEYLTYPIYEEAALNWRKDMVDKNIFGIRTMEMEK